MVRKGFQGIIFLSACCRFCPGTAYIVINRWMGNQSEFMSETEFRSFNDKYVERISFSNMYATCEIGISNQQSSGLSCHLSSVIIDHEHET